MKTEKEGARIVISPAPTGGTGSLIFPMRILFTRSARNACITESIIPIMLRGIDNMTIIIRTHRGEFCEVYAVKGSDIAVDARVDEVIVFDSSTELASQKRLPVLELLPLDAERMFEEMKAAGRFQYILENYGI